MASPNQIITTDHTSQANNEVLVITRPNLTETVPLFFPFNDFYYFSPPPIYFFPNYNLLPPPPSIFVFYPLWYINPNPNIQFESMQETPSLHSPSPSQELFLRTTNGSSQADFRNKRGFGRSNNKMTWRRRTKHDEDESNGDLITTVLLRNIPNRYTREMMVEFLDEYCEEVNKKEKDEGFPGSAYDFFYLPIDFRSGLNKGYAFVNFTNAKAVRKFKADCNQKPWSHFCSRKVLAIAYARLQGKNDLVRHFEKMTYPVEEYSAVCFDPARCRPKNKVQTIMVGKCINKVIFV